MGPHLEGVELQCERRQRQFQLAQLLCAWVVFGIHGKPVVSLRIDRARVGYLLVSGDRSRRRVMGGGAAYGLLNHGKLQHGRTLSFAQQRHEHTASVRKFDRVVMPIWDVLVDRGEFSHLKIDLSRPNPPAVVFDILGERQFRARQHTDRDIGVAL
jgi:hypothetical protein